MIAEPNCEIAAIEYAQEPLELAPDLASMLGSQLGSRCTS